MKAIDYEEAIRKVHRAGINIIGSFILGLDEDDPSVFRHTMDFILRTRIAIAQFHILTPFPGTRRYERMERDGRIIDRDWSKYHTSDVVFQPAHMTVKELQDGYNWIFRQTYSAQRIFNRVFRSLQGIPYRTAINISYRRKAILTPISL
jgi:radical SAM superfamily enzyme YgiQ (UPF0313 family)